MIYVISDGSGFVKIGTAENVEKRLKSLQCGNPRTLAVRYYARTSSDYEMEHLLHAHFDHFRIRVGNLEQCEWFRDCILRDLVSMSKDRMERLFHEQYPNKSITIHQTFEPYMLDTNPRQRVFDSFIETYESELDALLKAGLRSSTRRALQYFGCVTVEDVERILEADALRNIPNIGEKRVQEIRTAIENFKKIAHR